MVKHPISLHAGTRLPRVFEIWCKINERKCYILSLSQKIVFFNVIFATCAILTLQIRLIGVLCVGVPIGLCPRGVSFGICDAEI